MNKSVWMRLDEKTNTLDYLEKCAFFIQQEGKMKWKWVIITLRQALYCSCILAIEGSNYDRVLQFDKKKNKHRYKLINFPEAIQRIQNGGYMKQFVHSKTATLIDETIKDCNLLNKTLRNGIEHFIPSGWSIQLSGMPRIIRNVTSIISFLLLESGNVRLSGYKKRKVKNWINTIRKNSSNFN